VVLRSSHVPLNSRYLDSATSMAMLVEMYDVQVYIILWAGAESLDR
jgi:hypothetical protein